MQDKTHNNMINFRFKAEESIFNLLNIQLLLILTLMY